MTSKESTGVYVGFVSGGSRLSGRVYSGEGTPLGTTMLEGESEASLGPEVFCTTMGKLTTSLLMEAGVTWSSVSGVGVGLPAPLKDGVIQDKANLGHDAWTKWPARKRIDDYFEGNCVVIANDANAGAYGEWIKLGSEERKELTVVVTVGTGVGGGIVSDGDLIIGQGGAGEFGRVMIDMDPYKYWYPEKAGCVMMEKTVEELASMSALERQLEELFSDARFDPEHRHPLREVGRTNTGVPNWIKMTRAVGILAEAGDELCVNLFRLREEVMGRLFATIGLMFNPHTFVIGGRSVSPCSLGFQKKFITGVKHHMEARLRSALPGYDFRIVPAKTGDEAGAFGAAMLARDARMKQ